MHLNPIDLARDDALSERGLPPIAYADNPNGVYGYTNQATGHGVIGVNDSTD